MQSLNGDKAMVVDSSLSEALGHIVQPDHLPACGVSATVTLVAPRRPVPCLDHLSGGNATHPTRTRPKGSSLRSAAFWSFALPTWNHTFTSELWRSARTPRHTVRARADASVSQVAGGDLPSLHQRRVVFLVRGSFTTLRGVAATIMKHRAEEERFLE